MVEPIMTQIPTPGESNEAQDPSTFEYPIHRTGEDSHESCVRVLRDLHETLSPADIRQLDILLPWIYHSNDLSREFLTNVVLWHTGEPCLLNPHIHNKLKPFLELDEDDWVSAAFSADHLRAATSEYSNVSTEHPDIIYLETPARIESHIFQTCLEVLSRKTTDADFKPLRRYARGNLDEHLLAMDADELSEQELLDLGELICAILWDEEAIDALWGWSYANGMLTRWLCEDDDAKLKKLVMLLKNPHVKAAYTTASERSKGITAMMERPGNEARILAQVAKRDAARWLQSVDLDVRLLDCSYGIWVKIHWEGESKDCGPWARPSRAELEDFLTFAQEALSVPIDSVQLNARTALALWKYDFDEEAAAVCSTAKSDPGADRHWPLLLLRARIHQDADEYADALECIHTMMASNELSEDSDEAFTRSYWSEVLFIQGQHHRSLKQFDEAAECFLGFLQYIAKHERFQRSQCSSAVLELFKTWTEAEKYALIVDHVKQWKLDQTDDGAQEAGLDWFRILAPMTKFHSYLLLAVARTNAHEVIGALYDDAIEGFINDDGDEDSRRFADMLSFHRAYIFLYCSPSISEQDRGLNTLVQRILRPDDKEDWTTAALTAVSHATRALLTRAIALHKQLNETPSPHHQRSELETNLATIVTQLTTIATHSSPLLTACRRSPDTNPNLHLARLHLKLGDETASREIIRDLLEEQFDDWPGLHDLGELSDRYNNLAVILAAVDEDSDAVDAWRLMSLPGYSDGADETSEDESSSRRSGNSGIGSSSSTTRETFDEIPSTTDAHSDRKDDDDEDDEEEEMIPSDAVQSTSPQPAEDDPASTTTLTAAAESKTSPPELVFGRERTFSCDGACGASRNPLPEEFHVCRICPDVQFCTPCHAKLLKGVLKGGGTLPAIVCRPDHGFLYLPPFDRTAWAEIGSEAMLLHGRDSEVVSRQAWLEQLRAQWGSLR